MSLTSATSECKERNSKVKSKVPHAWVVQVTFGNGWNAVDAKRVQWINSFNHGSSWFGSGKLI